MQERVVLRVQVKVQDYEQAKKGETWPHALWLSIGSSRALNRLANVGFKPLISSLIALESSLRTLVTSLSYNGL